MTYEKQQVRSLNVDEDIYSALFNKQFYFYAYTIDIVQFIRAFDILMFQNIAPILNSTADICL